MITQQLEYTDKPTRYFSGARKLFVNDLPPNPTARLLEIGCGNGDTAVYAKSTGKCDYCVGVELCEAPALEAAKRLDQVIIGDIETLALPFAASHFDILIMSEVIEHLRDPWFVLQKLRPHLKSGAIVLAGSPNVAHHSVVAMLLRGRWDLRPVGIMDRTHLRWFTPQSYRELFTTSGYQVLSVRPASPLRGKSRILNRLLFGRFEYLFHAQLYLHARVP